MAVMWLFLATQKAPAVQDFTRDAFDMPGPHQIKKLPLVKLPIAILRLFVRIENIGRRRELWEVDVIDVADCLCEIPKIVSFREASKL